MYYYVIKDAGTGEVLHEGTATQLAESRAYESEKSVNGAYNSWVKRKRQGRKTMLEWNRTGTPDRPGRKPPEPKATGSTSEARLHKSHRTRSWQAKAARTAVQDAAAAASKKRKPDRYINDKLGELGTLPEHTKRFAQPPVPPPKAKGRDKPSALRWDVYELECLNWERRQQGKRALSYGEWRAGLR